MAGAELGSSGEETTGAPGQPTDGVSVFGAYKHAWGVFWDHFGILLVVWIVTLVLNGPASVDSLGEFIGVPLPAQLVLVGFGLAWAFLIGAPLNYGNAFVELRVSRDETPVLSDLFEGFRHYAAVLGSAFLTGLAVVIGLVFLIIPGIWIGLRLSTTPFMVVDRGLGAVDAIKASWSLTRGHALRILGFFLLAIPVMFLGLLALVVGVIPAGMWVGVAFASLYEDMRRDATRPDPEPAPAQDAGFQPVS